MALPGAAEVERPHGGTPGGRSWARIGRRYGWLMLDQSVFAITNLILNVLFAYWLTPSEYGRFAVTFSGFILLSVLHWFVVLEPLLVESARIAPGQVRAYTVTLVKAHVLIGAAAMVLSAAAYLVCLLLGASEAGGGIATALTGGCTLLTLVTARRLCLAFLSAAISAQVGACYLIAATASAWVLHAAGLIDWVTLWIVMGGWSLICAAAICAILLRRTGAGECYTFRDLWRATSRYAAWGTCSAGLSWIRSDGIYAVLAATAGLAAVAQTRAILMLNAPVLQVNSALMASWLVEFSRRGVNSHELWRTVLQRAAIYLAVSIIVLAAAIALASPVAHLVYRGKYDAGAWMLPLFLLAYLMNGAEGMLTSALKVQAKLRYAYLPHMLSSMVVGVLSLILIPSSGPPAAAFALVIGAAVGLGTAVVLFMRGCRPHE